jgi:hypothetical protein
MVFCWYVVLYLYFSFFRWWNIFVDTPSNCGMHYCTVPPPPLYTSTNNKLTVIFQHPLVSTLPLVKLVDSAEVHVCRQGPRITFFCFAKAKFYYILPYVEEVRIPQKMSCETEILSL